MSPTSYQAALSRDIIFLAEEKGFEPLRRFPDLPVFKTGPFNQLGYSSKKLVPRAGLEPARALTLEGF